jgi:molecular chaperone DnaK (HSP70)
LLFLVFVTSVANFLYSEETTRKYSASELEYYRKAYALKTSILARVIVDRLLEQEEAIKKMSRESKKLKCNSNLARAANLDQEKKVADLADALKKCEDEKKIVEDEKKVAEESLKNLKKDLEKLQKTHDEDL